MIKKKQSYSQSISQCFRLLCHASRSTLHTWSDVQRLLLILVRRFSNRCRGKSLRNQSFRISELTHKSTPTVTDTSHSLHMPESQDESDTHPHSNSQWYTTYDMFERKTCVKNKIIKNRKSERQNIARTPPCLKAPERRIRNNATDAT